MANRRHFCCGRTHDRHAQDAAGRLAITTNGVDQRVRNYVMFLPEKQPGVVLLANMNCPVAARVRAAYEILTRLDEAAAKR